MPGLDDHRGSLLALGETDRGRRLFVVFAIRGDRIRVISARDKTPREWRIFENAKREDPEADPTARR